MPPKVDGIAPRVVSLGCRALSELILTLEKVWERCLRFSPMVKSALSPHIPLATSNISAVLEYMKLERRSPPGDLRVIYFGGRLPLLLCGSGRCW